MTPASPNPPKPRSRFWVWLLIGSLALAAVEQLFLLGDCADWSCEHDREVNLLWLATINLILITINVSVTLLVVWFWKNRPPTRRSWFWLGAVSVALGILWVMNLCLGGAIDDDQFTTANLLKLWGIRTLIILSGLFILVTLRKFFCWLFSWRRVKWGLVATMALILLSGAFYTEENWRGNRAWENYRREWAAKGEKFNLIDFAPPPVPDDLNFAMAPVVASAYNQEIDGQGRRWPTPHTNQVNRLWMDREYINYQLTTNQLIGSWQKAKPTNLKPWQEYYRAMFVTNENPLALRMRLTSKTTQVTDPIYARFHVEALDTNEFPVAAQPQTPAADVLLALSKYDAVIEELRQAGERPYSRFPLDYQADNLMNILLPHLAPLKSCANILELRAIAEEQAGQPDKALADVKLMLRLIDSPRTEPFLISQLMRLAMANITIQPVWEGLAERRWSDAQLQELDAALRKIDFVSDLEASMPCERAYDIGAIDYLKKHRSEEAGGLIEVACPRTVAILEKVVDWFPKMSSLHGVYSNLGGPPQPANFPERVIIHLPPDGWFEQNKLAVAKLYEEHLLHLGHPAEHLIAWETVMAAGRAMEQESSMPNRTPGNALAIFFLQSLTRAADRFSFAQSAVDLARVACALERHRLATGEYPETLAALAPKFIDQIPPDVNNGQPLHYHRTNAGQFLLYSVGGNGKDDGGIVELNKYGRVNSETGDWVWQYPARN